jgi:hypothetical protein
VNERTLLAGAAIILLSACHGSDNPPPPSICGADGGQRPVATSSLPASQVIGFGTHTVGDQLSFNVPANTGSITIVHQARSAGLTLAYQGRTIDNSAVPLFVYFPDGGVAYDDNKSDPPSPDGGIDSSGSFAFYGGGTPSTAAFTMPNTSKSVAGGLPSGNWKFTVNDYANECGTTSGCSGGTNSNTYEVSVLLRPLPAGSNLDVNFFIVASATTRTGQPFTEKVASSDVSVQRMLQTFRSLYSAVGINIRNVNFYDASDADKARFGTNVNADKTGPCDELNQMLLLSAAHPGNTMNLFLVQSITSNHSSGGGTIVGIDGTIPGPATMAGTVHSGAAVSLADLFSVRGAGCVGPVDTYHCGADTVAYIAAHETGHFLGLFHTTELSGDAFDPISDTPKCPCLSCATSSDLPKCAHPDNNGPFLFANQCVSGNCGGGANLMFWQLDDTVSQGKLSAHQGSVMRLNPAVQ